MKHLLSFYFYLCVIAFSLSASDTTTIIILHTNDMHSHINKFSPLASYVDSLRKKYQNVFLFSAGDIFTGNPIVDKYKKPGYPIIDIMNYIGYDVTEYGNHEFDYGQNILLNRINQAKFPFICANMIVTSQSILEQPEPLTTFYTKDSLKIIVLGLLQIGKNGLPDAMPEKIKGITFKNPLKTVKKYKSYRDSCNVFILLSHLGFKTDKKLAAKYPFFDAIVGGHSHTVLPNGFWQNNTLITQAGHYTNYLGLLSIKLVNGQVIERSDTLLPLVMDTYCHYQTSKIIYQYNQNLELHTVIGEAKKDITAPYGLGALMTEAAKDRTGTDIAFQNIGGIRLQKIPAGNITIKQIYELAPFENTYVTYNLTPKQIKQIIKYAYNIHKKNELVASGIKFTPVIKNHRLQSIDVSDNKGNPLKKKRYSVTINNYMASAWKLKFLKYGNNTGIKDSETIINFIKKKKIIDFK